MTRPWLAALTLSLILAGLSAAPADEQPADEAYAAALARAQRLEGFRYLDTKRFTCGGQSHEIARFRHEATGLVFHLVPGGSYLQGSPAAEAGRDSDEEQRRVTIPPFLICATECTQDAWRKVTGSDPARFKGGSRPVEQVSWEDCKQFCAKSGLRLPSEAEWEYAARAGTTTPFAYGATITPAQVDYNGTYPYGSVPQGPYRRETVPAGSLPPNGFGLHEVHGNVVEFCEDVYVASYSGAPADGSARTTGAVGRVVRGGCWDNEAGSCRSARRSRSDPSMRNSYLGFRPARSLP